MNKPDYVGERIAKLRETFQALVEWATILERDKEFIAEQWKREFRYTSIRIEVERKGKKSPHLSYLKFRFYPLSKKVAEEKHRPKFSKFLGKILTRKGARRAKEENFWLQQRPVIEVFNQLCMRIRRAHRILWARMERIARAGRFTVKQYGENFLGLRRIEDLFAARVREARRIVVPPVAPRQVGGDQS